MTNALKAELLDWYKANNQRFVLLLISNRFDEHDKDLFSNKKGKKGHAVVDESSGPRGIIIEARGTVRRSIMCTGLPMILKQRGSPLASQEDWRSLVYAPSDFTPAAPVDGGPVAPEALSPKHCTDCGAVAFMYVFVTACYGLFGEEMLSLRFTEPIISTWFTSRPEDRGSTKGLVQALVNKHSYLPVRFVQQFVDTVKSVYDVKASEAVVRRTALWWQCLCSVLHPDVVSWDGDSVMMVDTAREASLHTVVKRLLADPASSLDTLVGATSAALSSLRAEPSNDLFWSLFLSGVGHIVRAHADDRLRSGFASCVECLVFSALLGDDGEAMSYPEFSTSGLVLDMHLLHPVYRLAQWVQYMYAEYGTDGRGKVGTEGAAAAAGSGVSTSQAKQSKGEDSVVPILWPNQDVVARDGEQTKSVETVETRAWAAVYTYTLAKFKAGLSVVDMPLRFPQVFLTASSLDLCEVRA
jgi:hypothetical protein